MKFLKYICFLIISISLLCSCSSGKNGNSNVSDKQLEEAHIAGREAAREFVNKKWTDTLKLQEHLVEAGAKASAYDSLPQMRAAFDSAFISTVRTVRPEIADQLESYKRGRAK